jgi:hypothetical protein
VQRHAARGNSMRTQVAPGGVACVGCRWGSGGGCQELLKITYPGGVTLTLFDQEPGERQRCNSGPQRAHSTPQHHPSMMQHRKLCDC